MATLCNLRTFRNICGLFFVLAEHSSIFVSSALSVSSQSGRVPSCTRVHRKIPHISNSIINKTDSWYAIYGRIHSGRRMTPQKWSYFCHGPRRRQAMALAPPIGGISNGFTNRQEQICLHWHVDWKKHACKTLWQFVTALGIFRIWWAMGQRRVGPCFTLDL